MSFYLDLSAELIKKAAAVKLLVMDADGTLSDGKLYAAAPGRESKSFFVRDGLGMVLLRRFNIKTAIITGRDDDCVRARAESLAIDHYYPAVVNKLDAWHDLLVQTGLTSVQCAFIGDDINDLPLIAQAGLGAAVSDCHETVRDYADYITRRPGGAGAVRELCDIILFAQNRYDAAVNQFTVQDETIF